MSRLVREVETQSAGFRARTAGENRRESYLELVAKYIPGEIAALYLAVLGILNDGLNGETHEVRLIAYGAVFLIFLILTPIYFTRLARPGDAVRVQRIVSSVAFLFWAYSLGGIFKELNVHREWLGGVLLIVFTAVSGAIVPYKKATTR